ncbi:unnamed protein product [Penicillium salamii]|uniref:Uncharacterized protein n=1 Tax=Penicillium salamii TaxID=1612424 RepID=A0A9W4NFC5_9EURO|nr:unnamed protein product [Penicillium salamii]
MSVASDKIAAGPFKGSGKSGKTELGSPHGLAALKSQIFAESWSSKRILSIRTSACTILRLCSEVAQSVGDTAV